MGFRNDQVLKPKIWRCSVHCCEFCGNQFFARPQVKCPRACNKCQSLRQRANEKAWHERHTHFDDRYHSTRREQRIKRIKQFVLIIVECLRVGQRLMGVSIQLEVFSVNLASLLSELGVRRINKFWLPANDDEFEGLAARLSANLMQTSSS